MTAVAMTICGANKRSGGTCSMKAGWGTDHVGYGTCKLHGGATPNSYKHAAKLKAAWEVKEWGGRLDVSPAEALLELVQTKASEVAYWSFKVSTLQEEERAGMLTVGTTDEQGSGPQGSFDKTTERRAADLSVYLVALHKAQDQLATFSAAALRAGVDEALVKIAAVQATAVIEFARKAMEAARRDPKADLNTILLALVDKETHS